MLLGPKSPAVLVFDLDGTLVEGIPYEEVLQQVSRLTSTPYKNLFQRYKKQWISLEEAERHHASLAGPLNAPTVHSYYRIFSQAKSHPTILPGTVALLERAKQSGKRLVCWTRGKNELQRLTLRNTRLEQFFHEIIVTPEKTRQTVQNLLLPVIGGQSFGLAGDSYEMDIVPVQGLATVRVWITESKANKYGERPAAIDPDVHEIRQIEELILG